MCQWLTKTSGLLITATYLVANNYFACVFSCTIIITSGWHFDHETCCQQPSHNPPSFSFSIWVGLADIFPSKCALPPRLRRTTCRNKSGVIFTCPSSSCSASAGPQPPPQPPLDADELMRSEQSDTRRINPALLHQACLPRAASVLTCRRIVIFAGAVFYCIWRSGFRCSNTSTKGQFCIQNNVRKSLQGAAGGIQYSSQK